MKAKKIPIVLSIFKGRYSNHVSLLVPLKVCYYDFRIIKTTGYKRDGNRNAMYPIAVVLLNNYNPMRIFVHFSGISRNQFNRRSPIHVD